MKRLTYALLTCMMLGAQAKAGTILFNFDNATPHTPLTPPLSLTVDGLTATLSSTGGDGFSIQTVGTGTNNITPTGFSGNCIFPSGINTSDLDVSFSRRLTDFSILFATGDLATDSAATMRVTAYLNGTSRRDGHRRALLPSPGPREHSSISVGGGFDSVVVQYDAPPPTGGDFTPVFIVDNMLVTTAAAVPEPASLTLLGLAAVGMIAGARLRRRLARA